MTENGLIAFSGLCNGIGSRINIQDFGNFLVFALKGEDDECVRLACGIVSDLAGAMKENINNFLEDFVPPMIDILRNSNQDRLSKLSAINALGDIAMNSGEPFVNRYLEDVLKILEGAAKLSLQMITED